MFQTANQSKIQRELCHLTVFDATELPRTETNLSQMLRVWKIYQHFPEQNYPVM